MLVLRYFLIEMKDASVIKAISCGRSEIERLTVTKDGSVVVTGSAKGKIVMWRIVDGTRIHTISDARSKSICGLNFTQNEEFLLSAQIDTIKMWSSLNGQCVAEIESDQTQCIAFNKDNLSYFIGSSSKIRKWSNSLHYVLSL